MFVLNVVSYFRFQGLDFEQHNSNSCFRPLGTTYQFKPRLARGLAGGWGKAALGLTARGLT